MAEGDVSMNSATLRGGSNELLGLAGSLQARRPEPEVVAVPRPAAHEEVAARSRSFAEHASDQFRDAVALLAALSSKVRGAAVLHEQADVGLVRAVDQILTGTTYRPGR
ncbi:hypothetical protein [Plantactinospora endophytica]|uniref:PE domain-containing protein n=1 Tax=Plantactinospora endophytica TaxID=673535 RepID=A0ABQ4E442_9ACTN|nr:hypothetical protein [Plantactinospora endophytica]GIG89469.1 hypothetical protein Pen02_44050 [Plantactinospora endophytica]